jgi:tetratricopeptide (TPR) repeat protein
MHFQKKNLIIFLLFSLIVLSAYSTNHYASWHFDDYPNIVDNPRIHLKDFKCKNVEEALFAGYDDGQYLGQQLYRPVSMLTLALNWYVGQDNVLGYHIVNNAIHLVTTFFLFLTVLNLLLSPNLKGKYQGSEYVITFLTAILWAVNPIQTQAVTYIVQRMASLAAMFYVIGIYFYLKTRLSPLGYKRFLFIAGSLLSFVLALGSKENTVTFPIAVAIIEILFFQNLKDKNIRRKIILALTIGSIAMTAILTILYVKGNITHLLKGYENRVFTLKERLLTEPRIIIYYLSQIFYPMASRLSLVHDINISTSLFKPWTTIPSILAIISLLGIGLSQTIKRPIIALSIFFFFINHIIESTILPLELIFEHRNYLPSFFLFFPIATGLIWLIDYFKKKNFFIQILLFVSIAGIIFSFCVGTIVRNRAWVNEKTLWEDCILKAPGLARPYHNLAFFYYHPNGYVEKAMEFYKAALTKKNLYSKTEHAWTLNNMAVILCGNRDFKNSIKFIKKTLGIKPHYPNALRNLTLLYVQTGRFSEALESADRLLSERKNSSNFLQIKGFVLLTAGRFDEAISIFKTALEIDPDNKKANLYMGVALSSKGEYRKADVFLKQAYELSPDDIFVHFARIENSVRNENKDNTDHHLQKLLESFDKDTIIRSLKRLDKNNIIAPLSQKILVDAINIKMSILANTMTELKNLDIAAFKKH